MTNLKLQMQKFDEEFGVESDYERKIKLFWSDYIKSLLDGIVPGHDIGCELQHTGECSCPVSEIQDKIKKILK
jgi:hypothetical protein